MIRAACLAALMPLQAMADTVPSISSMGGGRAHAECAAIFSLLEPKEPDADLRRQFSAASNELIDRVSIFHGSAFAKRMFEDALFNWGTRFEELGNRFVLAHRLQHCAEMTPVLD